MKGPSTVRRWPNVLIESTLGGVLFIGQGLAMVLVGVAIVSVAIGGGYGMAMLLGMREEVRLVWAFLSWPLFATGTHIWSLHRNTPAQNAWKRSLPSDGTPPGWPPRPGPDVKGGDPQADENDKAFGFGCMGVIVLLMIAAAFWPR